jgi:peptidylprolyl isomerase
MNKIYIVGGAAVLVIGGFFLFSNNALQEEELKVDNNSVFQKQQIDENNNIITPVGSTHMAAIMKTNMGDIIIEFFVSDAPKTVENFTKLAQDGFYNGVKFHRVIPDFMIQGGDPFSKDDSLQSQWGTGGPGYMFEDEIHANNKNNAGTIAMANAGPNTNGSQFFINVANNNFLDTKHTVFGKVVGGMDVVSAVVGVATEGPDRPVSPVVIESIIIENN